MTKPAPQSPRGPVSNSLAGQTVRTASRAQGTALLDAVAPPATSTAVLEVVPPVEPARETSDTVRVSDAARSRDTVRSTPPKTDNPSIPVESPQTGWDSLSRDLARLKAQQAATWQHIDEALLARYLSGRSDDAEVDLVLEALVEHPELRRCIDLAREALDLPPGPAVEALRSLSVSEQDRVWQNVQRDLAVYTDDEDETWGDVDEFLIAKYIAGTCSPDERDVIENALRTNPEIRECVELALGFEVQLAHASVAPRN